MRLMAGQRLGYAAQQMGHTVDMFVHTYTRWINDGHSALEDQKLEQFLALETPEVAATSGVELYRPGGAARVLVRWLVPKD
ncbi:MAG TPA: hypothetical protein VJN44_10445 [Roseateles sp.]|nr:hypothetical protein [Roseateles sp.]